jgi:hypothetical protein
MKKAPTLEARKRICCFSQNLCCGINKGECYAPPKGALSCAEAAELRMGKKFYGFAKRKEAAFYPSYGSAKKKVQGKVLRKAESFFALSYEVSRGVMKKAGLQNRPFPPVLLLWRAKKKKKRKRKKRFLIKL